MESGSHMKWEDAAVPLRPRVRQPQSTSEHYLTGLLQEPTLDTLFLDDLLFAGDFRDQPRASHSQS